MVLGCLTVRQLCSCCCCPDRRTGVVITGGKLGEGVNGVVYPVKLPGTGIDIPAATEVAVKIAAPWSVEVMETEGMILEKLQGCTGIPRLFFNDVIPEVLFSYRKPRGFGKITNRRALVIERFAIDLLHWARNVEVTELVVRKLCFQLVNILEGVHKFGILHLDIKPENIMFRKQMSPGDLSFKSGSEDQDIYLIDFGLAADFHDSEVSRKLGHPGFRSRSQHSGDPQGRKDDLEILANMAMLLLCKAPWGNLVDHLSILEETGEAEGGEEWQEVLEDIAAAKVKVFSEPPDTFPEWLSRWMKYVNDLDLHEPENYDHARSIFNPHVSES